MRSPQDGHIRGQSPAGPVAGDEPQSPAGPAAEGDSLGGPSRSSATGMDAQAGPGPSAPEPTGPASEPPSAPPAGAAAAQDAGDPQPGDRGQEQVEQDLDALLADAQRERDEYLELAKRTKADFENYRKRMASEVQAAAARGRAELAAGLLVVLDNLERALEAAEIDSSAEAAPEEPLAQGVLLTYRELCNVLERADVRPVDPQGERFDPNLHEALSKQPADGAEPGTVIEVMQKGYRLGEQLIRPARVVVAE